ncbi:MAG: asparagine synthase C-terminal domain-containing protein, partial [Gemmatimonadaceae bacterium]
VPITSGDLLASLPDFFSAMDQPSVDGLNTFVVSRAVSECGFKVVLSGLGGDELFGGYPSFTRARSIAPLWRLPPSMRAVGASAALSLGGVRGQRVRAALLERSPAEAAYRASRTLFDEEQISRLCGSSDGAGAAPDVALQGSEVNLMQQVSALELDGYMRNTLLRDSDVFSMAHGLELRVPFVDAGVAATAFMVAGLSAGDRMRPKEILVGAMGDILPPGILDAPKRGFTLPFETWLRGEMRDEVGSVLTGPVAASVGLDSTVVADVWNAFQAKTRGVNWSRPWALYTLARWASLNRMSQ